MDSFEFCFKGQRNYVHGSDIYNAIMRYLSERYGAIDSRVDLSFHRISVHELRGEVLDGEHPRLPASPSVTCRFAVSGLPKTLYLLDVGHPINCRYDYDEDSIVRNACLSHDLRAITCLNQTPYSPIEVVIALNKKLMQAVFAAEKGKWFFTRLALRRPLPDTSQTTFLIHLRQNMSFHITRSTIALGGCGYGDIYFSMIKGQADS